MSQSTDVALAPLRPFQPEPVAIGEPVLARLTLYTLIAVVAIMILMMYVTYVDPTITNVGGKIVLVDPVRVVQLPDRAIIKTIDVREGDQVAAGQLLGSLDTTLTEADLQQIRLQTYRLEAQTIRVEAEINGREPQFPDRSESEFKSYANVQGAIFKQRAAQYAAQLASFDGRISQATATIEKLDNDRKGFEERREIAQRVEEMRASLAQSGNGSQATPFISRDNRPELERDIENVTKSLTEDRTALRLLEAERTAFVQEWRAQLNQELARAQGGLEKARSSIEKAAGHADLERLTASEDSVVLTLTRLAVGSVLKPGEAFVTLMPTSARLEAEVKVPSRDIGFVREGDTCTMKVDASNSAGEGTVEGVVRWVSEGAFTADDDGRPVDSYYKARCQIERADAPAELRLVPGMTVVADVNVGRRSVAMQLLGGVLRGMKETAREP